MAIIEKTNQIILKIALKCFFFFILHCQSSDVFFLMM